MPMGQNTTTFNIDELITSYIDGQIPDAELKSQIEESIAKDAKLNAKYRAELLTRDMLRKRMPGAELTQDTYQNVMNSVDRLISEANAKRNSLITHRHVEYPSFWQNLKEIISHKSIGIPRYAFAMLAIFLLGGLFIFSGGKKTRNPYILSGTEKSIMVQAVNSFHKILDGDVKPQLSSGNAAEVEKYVQDKAHFNAYVPDIKDYKLVGVVCNKYKGQDLAHIIYRNGTELLYIYQTPVSAVQQNNLDLPEDVHNQIVNARYYMCDEVDDNDCTMTLWFNGNIICASMSTMPKQEMYATFSSFNK